MNQNLLLRFLLCFNGIFFAAFALVGYIAWESIWDFNSHWKQAREREHLSVASKALKQPLWNFDMATMEATLESFVQSESSDVIAVQVKDANGKTLMEKTIPSLKKKSFNDLFLDKTNRRISQKISADGQELGHVEMLLNTERIERAVRSAFSWYIGFLLCFAAICSGLFAFFWRRWISSPLSRMRRAVENKGWQAAPTQAAMKRLPNEMQAFFSKLKTPPSNGVLGLRPLSVVRAAEVSTASARESHASATRSELASAAKTHLRDSSPVRASVQDVVYLLRTETISRLENLRIAWTCDEGDWFLPMSQADLLTLLRSVLEQSIDSLNLSSAREKWIRWTIRPKEDRWMLSIHESRVGMPSLRPELRIISERLGGDVKANSRSTTSHWLLVLPMVVEPSSEESTGVFG